MGGVASVCFVFIRLNVLSDKSATVSVAMMQSASV